MTLSYPTGPRTLGSAPGRVNLIGEHTDYNGGFVLPAAIPQRTVVEVAPRGDQRVRVTSAEMGAGGGGVGASLEFVLGDERRTGTWVDYVQGVTWSLREHGLTLGGFDARIASDVPIGAGLSSSAALEVALLRALRSAFGLGFDELTLAKLAQRGENTIVGAPVGILDPMACNLADEHTALFLDTRSLVFERVPLPDGAELLVIDSGVRHDHAAGGYRTRRAECERAAALLGVAELRDVDAAVLPSLLARLPEPLGRRARHIVSENGRVLAAVAALRAGAFQTVGELFAASHASMRDDYEVSVPTVDAMVARALAEPDVYGARLTGGGFGGAVVAIARRGTGRAAAARIARGIPGARVLVPATPLLA
jgi:galactokinase